MLTVLWVHLLVSLAIMCLGFFSKLWLMYRGEWSQWPQSVRGQDLFESGLIFVGLLGEFAFLARLPYGGEIFWQVFSSLFVLYFLGIFWMPKLAWARSQTSDMAFAVLITISLAIVTPIALALVWHGFWLRQASHPAQTPLTSNVKRRRKAYPASTCDRKRIRSSRLILAHAL